MHSKNHFNKICRRAFFALLLFSMNLVVARAQTICDSSRTVAANLTSTNPTTCTGTGNVAISNVSHNFVPYNLVNVSLTDNQLGGATYGNFGIGSYNPNWGAGDLVLTPNVSLTAGFIAFANTVAQPNAFSANYDMIASGGSGGDGISFNYGDINMNGTAGTAPEDGMVNSGLSISFSEYRGDIRIYYNQNVLLQSFSANLSTGIYKSVAVTVTQDGKLTLVYGGTTICSNFQLPAAYATVNKSSWRYALAARCGVANNYHSVKNVVIKDNDIQYKLDNGNFTTATTFTGVAAGSHTIYARQSNGANCSYVTTVGTATITYTPDITATVAATSPANCTSTGGSITISNVAPGLSSPYDLVNISLTDNQLGAATTGNLGIGSYNPNFGAGDLVLTPTVSNTSGYIAFNSTVAKPNAFYATYDMIASAGTVGDGISFNYGNLNTAGTAGTAPEDGMVNSGLAIGFSEFRNDIRIYYDKNVLQSYSADLRTGIYKSVAVTVTQDGKLTLVYGGTTICSNFQLPATYATDNKSSWQYALAARCGNQTNNHSVKNVVVKDNSIQYTINGTDYTENPNFTNVTPATYNVRARISNGAYCGALSNLGSVTIASPGQPTTSTQSATACSSYIWNGTTYTTSGAKTWTGTNAAGCDSVATLNLTIKQPTTSTTTVSNCVSYTWNGTTYSASGVYTASFTNAAGCDSVATLNLTINQPTTSTTTVSNCVSYTWNGRTYSVSGVFTASFTNAAGCDSVATLNLTIKQPTASTTAVSICVPYTWNGTTYTASGSYTWTGTNSIGCDSVATLNFTLRSPTSSSESETACDSYHWNDSTYTSSGTYTWTGTNAAGCDSVVTLNLTILASTTDITWASTCDSYTWYGANDQTYTSSGTYTHTVSTVNGCIIRVLNLTITATSSNTTEVTACDSYTWSVNGQTYYSGGNYTSISDCATEILNLTIIPSTSSTTTASACDSYTWSVNGQTYTSGGNYTSISDCATEILNLTITPSTSSTTTASACDSYTWSVNGQTYTSSGSDTSVFGCATYILNLTITASTSNTTTASACDSYTWSSVNGQTYTTSGTYTYIGIGCNIEILNLTITASTSNTTSASACNSYTWSVNGQTYTSSGSYTSVSGCANEILNLTIKQPTSSTQSATACNSYIWHGITYTTSGTKTWTGTNAAGCDSVATLNLTLNVGTFNAETRFETSGYTWNGTLYAVSGTYTYSYNNSNGCASVDTLYLTVITNAGVNVKNVCTYIGTNEILIYTASVAGASSYTWSLPANTQLVSGQGTRSIAIKFLNGFAAQVNKQIRVTPAGGSLQIIYTNVQAPVTPASIVASSTNICQSLGTNVPITFTIPRVYEQASNGRTTTSYIWTAQNGTTTISHPNGTGENDTTVSITFTSNFTSSNVNVRALNACGVSGTRSYFISRNNPSQPSLISGPTNTCEYIGTNGQVATYSVSASASVDSYTWSVPQGAIGLTGQGTNTISFKYPAGYTSGSISVTATNNCGTSQSRSIVLSRLTPSTPGNIDVINTANCPNREYTYSLASIPGNATSLLWTVPTGATIVNGQGTRSITVSYPNGVVDGNVTVKAVSNCGVSGVRSLIIKLASCPSAPTPQYTKGVIRTMPSAMEVKVFPNPTTSSFNLQVTADVSRSAIQARVFDLQGRLMKTLMIHPNENISLGADLKPGVYMLEVLQGKEKKVVRVVKYN